MKINHIGVAVNNLAEAAAHYTELGFKILTDPFEDSQRAVCVQYLTNECVCIELVSPINPETPSPVDRYIKSGVGYAMYHTCYETPDITEEINILKSKGYYLMESPSPSPAMGNRKTAYLFHKRLGLTELVETKVMD